MEKTTLLRLMTKYHEIGAIIPRAIPIAFYLLSTCKRLDANDNLRASLATPPSTSGSYLSAMRPIPAVQRALISS